MDLAVLEAFDRAIAREAHNLSTWPELTWQQLHNRLQWEHEPVAMFLAEERRRRSSSEETAWARARTPFRESPGLLRTLSGHMGPVNACAVAPDGSYVVSASEDGTLKLWDPLAGRELRTLQVSRHELRDPDDDPPPLRACAVAPDGSFVVSGGWDLTVWNPLTGEEIRTFEGDVGIVRACAVAPDGSFFVSAGSHGLELWDPSTGKKVQTFHTAEVKACAVAPDGSFVVSGGWNLTVWDPSTGENISTWDTFEVNDCAVAPDGSFVVSAHKYGTLFPGGAVTVVEPRTGEVIRVSQDLTGPVNACGVAPDGSFVVSASDKSLKLSDLALGQGQTSLQYLPVKAFRILEGHTGAVNGCAFAPDGSFLISASEDGTLNLWDTGIAEEELR